MDEIQQTPIQSIETSVKIVETIERLDGARVSQLADEMDTPKSTVHDHLTTLETHGFLTKENDEYRVGLRFLTHGGQELEKRKVYRIAKPEIKKLSRKTEGVVNLVIEEHDRVVYLIVEEDLDAVIVGPHVGKRGYMHSTAVGKAILAHMPETDVEDILSRSGLPPVTKHTITSQEKLMKCLEEVRERGYAIDDQEDTQGIRCVAAPIMVDDNVLGGISVAGPMQRFTEDRMQNELAEQVLQTTNVVEINILGT